MSSLGHTLYKGDIYVKSPSAKFTYVLIVKCAKGIIEIMCYPECEVIKQIKFNWDLIEVKDGNCFSINNRDFIEWAIDLKDIGIISPRELASYYDSSEDPSPLYLKE